MAAAAAVAPFQLQASTGRAVCLYRLPPSRRPALSVAEVPSRSGGATAVREADAEGGSRSVSRPVPRARSEQSEYRRWREKEAAILRDVGPTIALVKQILHSDRYIDGERLSPEDEKAVVEKILAYHPRCKDKIGCGLRCIMVDRHPEFQVSRCLFVIRADGLWIDFSYQKCLKTYVRSKYPLDAERFIKEHFKRS